MKIKISGFRALSSKLKSWNFFTNSWIEKIDIFIEKTRIFFDKFFLQNIHFILKINYLKKRT